MRQQKVKQMNDEAVAELLNTRRWCWTIPESGFVERHGYRPSICIENVKGHYPNGDMDTLSDDQSVVTEAYKRGGKVPWFWGMALDDAKAACDTMNQERGLTPQDVAVIIGTTLG